MSAAAGAGSLTALVNPFIGTLGGGHTFPGASAPFGMVQPSPRTPNGTTGGGYDHADDRICGFSTLHISGPGCPAYGHITLMPLAGPDAPTEPGIPSAPFSHDDEQARAGYYAVGLPGLARVELTATERVAWYRTTFEGAQRRLAIDLSLTQTPTSDARLAVVDEHTLLVSQTAPSFGEVHGDPGITAHAVVRFSAPVVARRLWDGGGFQGDSTEVRGVPVGAVLDFGEASEPVEVAVAVSFVDHDGAQRNLEQDPARVSGTASGFDAALAWVTAAWEAELGRVTLEGAGHDDLVIHTTALYHALLQPTLCSDVDGRYLGADRRVHQTDPNPADGSPSGGHRGERRRSYTNFSLWDTYRTHQPLLALLCPARAREVMLSLLATTHELGSIPRWVLGGVETNLMSGDAGTLALVQAFAMGTLTADELEGVFGLLVANARRLPEAGSPAIGRHGVDFYREHGYVAYEREHQHSCGSASVGLEWSLADAALAWLSLQLGHEEQARDFEGQAARYPTGFDAGTGFFRPRLADGSWLGDFDPAHVTALWIDRMGFEEGSAWQYLVGVPHDPEGWAELLGGRSVALDRLDQLFALEQVRREPGLARTLWHEGSHYAAWNEHDMQAPWTYAALGLPSRSDLVVNTQLEQFFGPGPDGLPDNDDLGTMSAWYLLAAWGLYPYVASLPEWLLTLPRFQQVRIVPDGAPAAATTIRREGDGDHVTEVTLDGHRVDRGWLDLDQLRGAEVVFRTGTEPVERQVTPPTGLLTRLRQQSGS